MKEDKSAPYKQYQFNRAPFAPLKVKFSVDSREEAELWAKILGPLSGDKSRLTYNLYEKIIDVLNGKE